MLLNNLTWANHHRTLATLLPVGLALSAALLGVVIANGNILLLLVFVGAICAAALLTTPIILLWIVLIGGLVFSGLAELYIPQLRFIRWAVVVGAMALIGIALIRLATKPPSRLVKIQKTGISPLAWLALFGVVAIFSGIINQGLSFDTIIGFKGYFQVWGVAFAMAWFALKHSQANRILTGLIWLAFLQIPFAFHQYLVLVPLRLSNEEAQKGIVALDIVVGTFVGNMEGGGGNVILASLQVIAIGIMIGLWRAKIIASGTRVFLLSLVCLLPIALNEAKAVVLFIPIMLAIVFQDALIKRPLQALLASLLVAILMFGLLALYSILPKAAGQQSKNLSDFYEEMVAYNVGDKAYGNELLNRTTVYSYWAERHGMDNLPETLIGHGPGATNEDAELMNFSLARNVYPGVGIGLTGISSLLWEVGLIGTFLMIGIYIAAFKRAQDLAAHFSRQTRQYAYLKAVQAGLAVLAVNLLHNNYLLFELGFQTLLMVLLGYIFHMERVTYARKP